LTTREAALAPRSVSVFRNIERKIGGMVEGVFGRTFRSSVQPVELARKLAKEMDDHRTISIHRVYVPSVYTIYLNPADREQFAAYEAQMCSELEEYLVEHARREGYTTASRPVVTLETEDDLHVGMFGIAVETGDEEELGERPPPEPSPEPPAPSIPVAAPLPPVAPGAPPVPAGSTMVYAPEPEPEPEPAPAPAAAEVVVLMWEGREHRVGSSPITVIGRSSECDIVVGDPNVSRRHAEVRKLGRGYSLVDLGSTNGTEVNGQRVTETSLMNGDVIGVGTTQITFERRIG
jgi:FHA domain-containing protein